jgi:hypothetical protein
VQEDTFERKKRVQQEEEEEKIEEDKIQAFKELKRSIPSIPEEDEEVRSVDILEENIRIHRPVKKRPVEVPEGGKAAKRRRVVEIYQEHQKNQPPQHEQEQVCQKDGRLARLRRRMEEEKRNVLDYLEKKKEMEIIEDVGAWWTKLEQNLEMKFQKDGKQRRLRETKEKKIKFNERMKLNFDLEGWSEWWKMIELNNEKDGNMKRLSKAEGKKKFYQERVQPNLILVGWRGWWSRMEAEMIREISSRRKEEGQLKKRILSSEKKTEFVRKFFPSFRNINGNFRRNKIEKQDWDNNGSVEYDGYQTECENFKRKDIPTSIFKGGHSTPKRKLSSLQVGENCEIKKRKLSTKLSENLMFSVRMNHNINFNEPDGLSQGQREVTRRNSLGENVQPDKGPIL